MGHHEPAREGRGSAPDTPEVTVEEAQEALDDARSIVEAMQKFLPNVGPWRS